MPCRLYHFSAGWGRLAPPLDRRLTGLGDYPGASDGARTEATLLIGRGTAVKPSRTHSFLVLLCSCSLAIGCSSATEPEQCNQNSKVTVSVGAGPTPDISWSPACFANSVLIEDDGGNFIWAVGNDYNEIAPPVRVSTALGTGNYTVRVVYRDYHDATHDDVVLGYKFFSR